MRKEIVKAELLIAQIAGRQHGVISSAQLLWAGLSPASIDRRVRSGRLHRLYRGVYAVGHRKISREGKWLAAVLACGTGAVLSHESAACLWGISPTCPPFARVTVPTPGGRSKRRGIVVHRSRTLGPRDTTRRKNIPVTSPARTRTDMGWGPEPTRSHLERLFLNLVRRAGIPRPEVNVKVGPYTVDFLWRTECLIVETDGYEFHSSRASFERDRARDRYLQAHGFVVLRFTYREVTDDPEAVVTSLRAHL